MPRPTRVEGLRRLGLFLLLLLALPLTGGAVEHRIDLLLDLDNDSGTGCLVNTVDGPFDGVEQILTTTVETTSPPDAGTVTEVATRDCIDGSTDTFGAPAAFDGPWPAGIDNGVGGRDVVETYAPLARLVVADPLLIRLGVVLTDDQGREEALLTTDDTPSGGPIYLNLGRVLGIPTLGQWGLGALAVLLALGAMQVLGRRGGIALCLMLLLLGASVAWAAGTLDGQTDDWTQSDLLASDGMVLFGRPTPSEVCFRIDVDLVFNGAPIAIDDSLGGDEDTVLMGNVLADNGGGADSDPNGDPISVTAFDAVSTSGATVTVASNGDFTYDPTGAAALQGLDDGESVDDGFGYTIEDPAAASDSATVTVTVDGVNDAPTAMADNFETDEDTALVIGAPGVLVNDGDIDGETITAVLDTDVSDGTLTLNSDGSFSYTPDPNFNGADGFSYHANDGTVDSPTVVVTIMVGPINDGANAVDDMFATDEDTVLNVVAPGVLTNDSDAEGDPLSVTAFDAISSQGASVSVNADGSFTYDPTGAAALQGLSGGAMVNDSFTYTAEDDQGGPADMATVVVEVTGVDDPPTAVSDFATVDEDSGASTLDVLANDTDPDGGPITIAMVTQPANGTVLITNAGADLTYEPDTNYCNNGGITDDFTYTLSPGGDIATVSVAVLCVNDPPVADNETVAVVCNLEHVVETDAGQTAAGSSAIFRTVSDNVLVGDSDPVEGDAISIVQASGTTSDGIAPFEITTNQGGSLSLYADGSFVYTPEGGDRNLADSFSYTIQDAEGGQAMGTVTLNVADTCIWFVDNAVNPTDGTGDGTSSDPFSSLVDEAGPDALADDAEDASQAGDVVYVLTGASRTGDPYVGGYTARANERILGQGVDLVVDLGSGPETLFDSDETAADFPRIELPTGSAFSVVDVTGVEIGGFELDVGDEALAASAATMATGVAFHDNEIPGAGSSAILAVANNGDLELALDDNTEIAATGIGIFVDTPGTGTAYVTSFCGNQISGDTVGTGVSMNGVVFDADPSTLAFEEVECTTGTTIGDAGNRVGGGGLDLQGVTGDLDLGALDAWVGTAGGLDEPALRAVGTGVFNAGTGIGFQLTTDSGTLDSADGPAVDVGDASLENVVLTALGSQSSGGVGVGLVDISSGSFQVTGTTAVGNTVGDGVAITDSIVNVTFTGPLTISTTGTEGVSLDDLVGTFSAANATSSIAGTTGDAFNSLSSEGNVTYAGSITNTAGNSVDIRNHGGAGATSIVFSGPIDDDGAGIFLDNNDQGAGSTVSFAGGLDLDTGTNTAFSATNGGVVSVVSNSVSTTADTTTGTVVNFVNTTIGALGVTFDSTSSTGGAAGIVLTNVGSGDFVSLGGSLANQTDRGVDVSGGSGDLRVDASISTTSTGRSVEVTTHTGGTVDFNGFIDDNGLGIRLANNVGSVLRFDGGMDVDTAVAVTEEGFEATGGGTVHVTGTNDVNTSLGTGAAVNIANATIGSDDVTFRNVSANGAPSGIVLANTGTTGAFVVTGDGATGAGITANNDSGGSILNSTGDGVQLTSVSDVTLDQMRIQDAADHGIDGSGVTDLTLTRTNLVSNGTANQEHGLYLLNPSGTITVANALGDGNFDAHLRVFSQTGNNLTLFSVDDSVFQNVTTGFYEDGISFEAQTGVTTAISVTGSTFANHDGDHIQASSNGSAVMGVTITGNTLTGTASNLGAGITVNSAGTFSGATTFDVSSNNIQKANDNSSSINLNIGTSTATGTYTGTVSNNTIGTQGTADSAGDTGIAAEVNQSATMTVTISGNTVREFDNLGINVGAVDGTGTINATITGNTVASADSNAFAAVFVDSQTNNIACADIGGAGALGNALSASAGFTDVAFQTGGSGVVNLEGYAGTASNQAQIQTYIQGRNTGAPGVQLNVGGGPVQGGGACPIP